MAIIKLDLVPSNIKPVLRASQYDDGRQWPIEIYNDGVPFVFQVGDTVELNLRKGDGLVVTFMVAVQPGSNSLTLVSTQQMCAIYGSNLGELKITSNGALVGSCNFILEVEQDPTGGDIQSRSTIWDLQAQVDDCTQKALENIGAKGLPFDNEDTDLEATNTEDAIKEVNAKVEDKADADSVYTKEQVDQLIDDLPEAMIFKGTLGVGGTITALPTASAENEGYTYKVITAGTYAGQSADVGDMFTSNGSEWVLIPAGDEDSYTREEADEKFATINGTYTKAKVDELVGKVQSDIDELNAKIYGGTETINITDFELNKAWGFVTVGSTMPENPVISGYANYAGKISVKNGDIIAYKGSVGGTSKLIYLTDTSGVVLSFVEADSIGSTVTVSSDGYAYITVLSTSEYAFTLTPIDYLSKNVEDNTTKVNTLSAKFDGSLFKEDYLPLRIIDNGSINYFNGYDNSDPAVLPLRCRTSGYIDKNIDKIVSKNASYTFGLFAYQEDGTFVGVWNGTTWQKTNNYWHTSIDGLIEKGYRYRLVWNRNNATVSPIDVRPVTKATTYNFETVEELKSKNDNRLFLDSPVNAPFKCPAYNSITGGNIATFAEIYSKFDALVTAYPTYITKTKIGEANNDANLPIYKYVFKPKRPHYDEVTATRNANILLIGGEHGEQVGATCVYNVMEQICNNWQSDELLEALRFNPTFTVIPVLNVWGYDAGKRVNANNVNLNRNYGTGWIAIPDTEEQNYSGTKAFSEIETQCVRDILKAEKFDIVFDVHNPAPTQGLYFAGEVSNNFTYTQTGVQMSVDSEMSTNMTYKAIQRLTRIWDSRGLNLPYPTGAISGEFHGVCVGAEAGGMSCLYANDLGVSIAGVLEVCPKVDITGATYGDSASQTFAFETVINMLLMSLDYISVSGV